MPLQPSIVVTSQDSPDVLLVASVQGSAADLTSEETELKVYMARRKCPVGMLVTPERARFYRNNFTDYTTQTVELIGECPTVDLLEAPEKVVEPYLEYFVQEWLEGLSEGVRRSWPSAVREAIEFSVIPMVIGCRVRAGGPRWRRTA
jgi:hypothetical protein